MRTISMTKLHSPARNFLSTAHLQYQSLDLHDHSIISSQTPLQHAITPTMSCSAPTFNSASSYLTIALLNAIAEAGSYPPASSSASLPRAEDLHAPQPRHDYIHQQTEYLPDPIEDIVFRLLAWPLSSAYGVETVVLGLPLVIQCFGEHADAHMQYDERVHRLCLRAVSDVRWRGEQLGLPKTYVDWLCAEGQKGAVNILKVGYEQLDDGLRRWQEVTRRNM
ncbi:uncharacterized protein M421DRAFT_402716 [Didymella exigua CBS 183.55]|uniref:Uncharacterized protein n=1 Tax=Didymella exigua CBS 183.55 TaxID=1150837 RepID=A0A6A5R885_9PLEO|nr:uncharacterized protein M421DRAFT_402716 [Didymella exigua CBS 183.55]KAF1924405.1 hypothetical protein M421DRAFT_402716 [Didymella exigua CBS 183.55]